MKERQRSGGEGDSTGKMEGCIEMQMERWKSSGITSREKVKDEQYKELNKHDSLEAMNTAVTKYHLYYSTYY